MEAPSHVADTAVPQSLPSSPDSFQAKVEASYLIRGDVLLYRLMCIFRYLLRTEYYDTCVPNVTQVMPSGNAPGDISEGSTIQNRVSIYLASLNGLAPTSTGITSRPGIQVSTPT